MTLLAFLACFFAAWVHYAYAGAILWKGGPTIYMAAMYAVMAFSAFFAVRSAIKGRQHFLWSNVVLVLLVIYGWRIGWLYGPPGLLHGALYSIAGACFLGIGSHRYQYAIGAVLLLLSAAGFANVLGFFPPRSRTFTGFYYPDVLAYGMHFNFILIGAVAGDGLRNIVGRVWPDRGRGNRVLAWAAHRRSSQKVVP